MFLQENGNFLFSKLKCNKEARRLYAELVYDVVPKIVPDVVYAISKPQNLIQ